MTDSHRRGIIRSLMAGMAANCAIGLSKLVAWGFTGSAAMLAEAFHSFADTGNQILLFVGMKRADRPPTPTHPLGYSKERYFWAFVVALMIFLVGAVFSIYEGIHKIVDPVEVRNVGWNYGALGAALVIESFALSVAWREFRENRRDPRRGLIETISTSKDPTLPTVMFEDSAAITGLLVALVGITASWATGDGIWDAMASLVIGVLLLGVAGYLARRSHSLLLGEGASAEDVATIEKMIEEDRDVLRPIEIITLQRGPEEVLVALNLKFREDLKADEVEAAVVRIEKRIRDRIPAAHHIFVEAGSIRTAAHD